ncbi:chromatin structure-remodeling complex subunit Rsc9p [[Candida] railenensis]|uniref:Chromatin structure-remodeling complex subunit Rsc9p n=1 Tax=[Candida] railenensis TaxID=45579 RepID=A0A9P0QVV9_9ASCO|nr:chromatin structure-remodeling complex subunit Rsc9p [[Candida] railenensis]
MPAFTPVSSTSAKKSSLGVGGPTGNGIYYPNGNGYNPNYGTSSNYSYSTQLLGSGNLGPNVMSRVFMSFRSGIDSEIRWALTTLCSLSLSSPNLINFEKFPVLGNELIKWFTNPFRGSNGNQISEMELTFALDSVLTLRNASQDLINQQWLSQVKNLKKTIVTVLKQLVNWLLLGKDLSVSVLSNINRYHEVFGYLLDLVETLSCYWVDNGKNDALFKEMLIILEESKDKGVILGVLKSLGNLLIIKGHSAALEEAATGLSSAAASADDSSRDPTPIKSNCIDSIPKSTLHKITQYLLLNDSELNFAIIQFLKQYLSSEALNASYPTVQDSQQYRLNQLIESSDSLKILIQSLPQLILQSLPLNIPTDIPNLPPTILSRRALHSSVPTIIPSLTTELYDVIVKFHEPLRASTWLRCCYEPVYQEYNVDDNSKQSSAAGGATGGVPIPGEVTQISLWKAYEKQFEKVWQPSQEKDVKYPKLLPAVDFIKNVSAAFPHSQAMVVNTDAVDGAPKRKFIIKGIQPRQFVVNIDVGNYDALRQKPSVQSLEIEQHSTNSSLPVGHVDHGKFHHNLNAINSIILQAQQQQHPFVFRKDQLPILNLISSELLEYVLSNTTEEDSEHAHGIFRYENSWMKDLIYANPGLVDSGILNEKWLEILI